VAPAIRAIIPASVSAITASSPGVMTVSRRAPARRLRLGPQIVRAHDAFFAPPAVRRRDRFLTA
jgi:hypothetical protein